MVVNLCEFLWIHFPASTCQFADIYQSYHQTELIDTNIVLLACCSHCLFSLVCQCWNWRLFNCVNSIESEFVIRFILELIKRSAGAGPTGNLAFLTVCSAHASLTFWWVLLRGVYVVSELRAPLQADPCQHRVSSSKWRNAFAFNWHHQMMLSQFAYLAMM